MISFDLVTQLEAMVILSVIALAASRYRFLDKSGVAASIPIGYLVIVFGGLRYFALLFIFFLISSLATRIRVRILGESFVNKDHVRSWRNVIANGLTPTFIMVLSGVVPSMESRVVAAGYLGAIGTAFADTLATEVGMIFGKRPRLIIGLRKVERGTPGAVTCYGYLGGASALLLLCALAWVLKLASPMTAMATVISGILGMTIDSFLGAGIQAKYLCRVCGKIVESPSHCGREAEKIAGVGWIDTHMVNLISTAIGAAIAAALANAL
ncbi:MAG: hypothetical protein DRN64_02535 [Thaumarchaeota archaeon]|nr:MAG: hypothetical protein DRN64_02535 [Nitrososphaerota archaeon]